MTRRGSTASPQTHKHLPEMAAMCGLAKPADLLPDRGGFLQRHGRHGSALLAHQLTDGATAADVKAVLKDAYGGSIVRYTETADADGFLSAARARGQGRDGDCRLRG